MLLRTRQGTGLLQQLTERPLEVWTDSVERHEPEYYRQQPSATEDRRDKPVH